MVLCICTSHTIHTSGLNEKGVLLKVACLITWLYPKCLHFQGLRFFNVNEVKSDFVRREYKKSFGRSPCECKVVTCSLSSMLSSSWSDKDGKGHRGSDVTGKVNKHNQTGERQRSFSPMQSPLSCRWNPNRFFCTCTRLAQFTVILEISIAPIKLLGRWLFSGSLIQQLSQGGFLHKEYSPVFCPNSLCEVLFHHWKPLCWKSVCSHANSYLCFLVSCHASSFRNCLPTGQKLPCHWVSLCRG